MNRIKNPVQMHVDDVLVLNQDQEVILQKCCSCGAWHEIVFIGKKDTLKIQFNPIDGEPDKELYECTETVIETT